MQYLFIGRKSGYLKSLKLIGIETLVLNQAKLSSMEPPPCIYDAQGCDDDSKWCFAALWWIFHSTTVQKCFALRRLSNSIHVWSRFVASKKKGHRGTQF